MGWRSLMALLVLVLLGAFAAANWGAFTAPTDLSLGVARVHFPLGLLMLGLCAVLALGLGGLALWVHARSLFELRRQLRQQQSLRELADKAEASRVAQLQEQLRAGLERIDSRLDTLQREQARQIAENADGLAAALAEFDQRISGAVAAPRRGD